MAKRDLYFDDAEELYVMQALTLESIAKRLPVSTRTLQEWKVAGDWDRKRVETLRIRRTTRAEMEELCLMLVRNVKKQLDKTDQDEPIIIDPVQGRLILGLQKTLLDAKKYEDAIDAAAVTDDPDATSDETASDDDIARKVSELVRSMS